MRQKGTEMPRPIIDEDMCIGCGVCEVNCVANVLDTSSGVAEVVNPDDCVGCGACMEVCPAGTITDIED